MTLRIFNYFSTQFNSHIISAFLVINLLLIGNSSFIFAQQSKKKERVKKKKESNMLIQDTSSVKKIREKLAISGVRLGGNGISLLSNVFSESTSGFELNADVMLNNKFYIAFDLGYLTQLRDNVGSVSANTNTFQYSSDGSYYRFGVDYNLSHKKTDDEGVLLGLRYGSARFTHDLTYTILDDYWVSYDGNADDINLTANWLELVFGLRSMVLKNLYLAPTIHINFKVASTESKNVQIAEIPGYGKGNSSTTVQFGYSIIYRIPLKDLFTN